MTENSEIDTYLRNAKDFAQMIKYYQNFLDKFEDELKNFSKENILKALNLLTDLENDDGSHSERVQGDDEFDRETPFRRLEYRRLLSNDSSDELIIEKKDIDKYQQNFSKYFSSISLIKKLRETRVLYGFSRLFPDANKDKDVKEMQKMLRKKVNKHE